jgi:hypothetical protein
VLTIGYVFRTWSMRTWRLQNERRNMDVTVQFRRQILRKTRTPPQGSLQKPSKIHQMIWSVAIASPLTSQTDISMAGDLAAVVECRLVTSLPSRCVHYRLSIHGIGCGSGSFDEYRTNSALEHAGIPPYNRRQSRHHGLHLAKREEVRSTCCATICNV